MNLGEAVLAFYKAAVRLKNLRRTGWVERGVDEPETVAAHAYAATLLAVLLADLRGMDVGEAARMMLIHDLPEAVIGDLTPRQKERVRGLAEKELSVIRDLAKKLPEGVAEKYLKAWKSYMDGLEPVARLVKDVDKLEMGLQALEYVKAGNRKAIEIYRSALSQIKDPELRRILEEAGKEV